MNLLEVFSETEDLVSLPSHSILFEEGANADFMYVIMKGGISLSLHGTVVGTAHQGDVIGEMALLGSEPRSATATTVTDCVLAPIDVHSFKLLIQHTPEFALHVMNLLADRLRFANERLSRLSPT